MLSSFFLSLVLASPGHLYAQNKDLIGATFRDFSGGMVDSVDASALQPNQSPNLQNVLVDDPVGSLKPRKGYAQCGATPSGSQATALYEYTKSDGSRKLIVSDNTSVWETGDCVSYSTITTGLTSTSRPSMSIVRDKLWVVNGSTYPFTWNGTTKVSLDGTGTSPNPGPPQCRYIEFWRERVWCARTNTNPSSVAFSALTDSAGGDLNPSTGTAAWPATNVFYIDQEGGSAITGLKAFKDRLYVFKNNGIWEIEFTSDFDNGVKKTFSSVGARFNTAIVELDGVLYFAGQDGIYAFDGSRSVRISDSISNTYKSVNQLLSNELFNLWTENADFSAGTLSSTTVSNGEVTLSLQPTLIDNGNFETGTFSSWSTYATGSGSFTITNSPSLSNSYSARVYSTCTATDPGTQELNIYNTAGTTVATISSWSRLYSTTTVDTSGYEGSVIQLHFRGAKDSANTADIWSTTFTARSQFTFTSIGWTCSSDGKVGWQNIDYFLGNEYVSSGTITSSAFNAVTVSTWSTFDATSANNGGSISYQYRTATSEGGLAAQSWNDITPGSIINSSVDRTWIQWKAVLTPNAAQTQTPQLQEVSVSYFQGGDASKAIFMAAQDNRLWVAVSTGSSSHNNMVLVKSKNATAWTRYDIPLGPMTHFNDAFYGASSTSSLVYHLENGTNDNGTAIEWYWQSRDEMFGLPNNKKALLELTLDFRNDDACNLNVGYSGTGGVQFCVAEPVTANLEGYGSKRLFVNGGNYLAYRFQICNSTKDETATITGITGWARPYKIRE